jgi:hypothetical protein
MSPLIADLAEERGRVEPAQRSDFIRFFFVRR